MKRWMGILLFFACFSTLTARAAVVYQFPNGSQLRLSDEGMVHFLEFTSETGTFNTLWTISDAIYVESTPEEFEAIRNRNTAAFNSTHFVPAPSSEFTFVAVENLLYVVRQDGNKFPMAIASDTPFVGSPPTILTHFEPIQYGGKVYRGLVVKHSSPLSDDVTADIYLIDEGFEAERWMNVPISPDHPNAFMFVLKGDSVEVAIPTTDQFLVGSIDLTKSTFGASRTVEASIQPPQPSARAPRTPETALRAFKKKLTGSRYYHPMNAKLTVSEVNQNRNSSVSRDVEARLRALTSYSGNEVPFFTIYKNREYLLIGAFAEHARALGMPFETSALIRFEKPVGMPSDQQLIQLDAERQRLATESKNMNYFYIVPGDGFARVYYIPAGQSAVTEPVARVGKEHVFELTDAMVNSSMPNWFLVNSSRVSVPELSKHGYETLSEGEYSLEQISEAQTRLSSDLPLVIIKGVFDIRDESFVDELLVPANYAIQSAFYIAVRRAGKSDSYRVIRIDAGTSTTKFFSLIVDCDNILGTD